MELTIPLYVESQPGGAGKRTEYLVRPLFHPQFTARSPFLQRATNDVLRALRAEFVELGKLPRHDSLAAWTWNPPVRSRICEIHIETGKLSGRIKLLAVLFHEFDRQIVFSPTFPELWFELLPHQDLETRLAESVREYFRDRQRDGDARIVNPAAYSLHGPAWLSEIQFRTYPPRVRTKSKESLFAFLGSEKKLDGASELNRVGRCLNHLYPDDLARVLLREGEVAELTRVLRGDERRPVLLLGPRQVGKTALVHEYVFRHVKALRNPHDEIQGVWLLSPQRLISGMQYVGQWESRLHAILQNAFERDLVLYLDDVLGLFQAGKTMQSSLNVAAVLKTAIERRRVRVLAEQTPEAFRVLRERDRGLADLFHVLPVNELQGDENLRVLISLQRQLESRHRCRLSLDALPTVIDLQRRYARDVAFPGKGANFLKRLAVKAEGEVQSPTDAARRSRDENPLGSFRPPATMITRDRVLTAFHEQTGLPRSFFDQQRTLSVAEIREQLAKRFVGQPQAVQAAVEILGIAKARLNDVGRPLASLLLLGPTGVGKTEFAKSLAAYLFGNADRLLRFDMNEYVSPLSVPQLVGTFAQPEGLLTSEVRRQPFAVVLFDEIEKGHPDVFDLLLQVLGEGRLTDALGRTTDFSNTIVVLTSNLGTQRSATGLGFGSDPLDSRKVVRAAEKFFRPEFFNRLDRVIPFARLENNDLQVIAQHLLSDVLQRDGLVRRQCVLKIAPTALNWILRQGNDPVLGARALKRAIERELTRPIAGYLAARGAKLRADAADSLADILVEKPAGEAADAEPHVGPMILIDVDRSEAGLAVAVRELVSQAPIPGTTGALPNRDVVETLDRCDVVLQQLTKGLPNRKPTSPLASGRPSALHSRYFTLQEELSRVREWLVELRQAARSGQSSKNPLAGSTRIPRGPSKFRPLSRRKGPSRGSMVDAEAASDEINEFVFGGQRTARPGIDIATEARRVEQRLGWLAALSKADESQLTERLTVRIDMLDRTATQFATYFARRLVETWSNELGFDATLQPISGADDGSICKIQLDGPLARAFASAESGFHALRVTGNESPRLISVQIDDAPIPNRIVRTVIASPDEPAVAFPNVAVLRDFAFDSFSVPIVPAE